MSPPLDPVASDPVLPEAARVEVLDQNGGWTEFRWGALHGWVPAATLRAIDKP